MKYKLIIFLFLILIILILIKVQDDFIVLREKKKYLVYKGTGGLNHCLGGLYNALQSSIKHNCVLLIDTQSGAGVGVKFSKIFNLKLFQSQQKIQITENYNNLPNSYKFFDYTVSEIEKMGSKYTENGIFFGGYKVPNEIKNNFINIYSGDDGDVTKLNLKVNNYILKIISELHKIKGKYISIHFRNTDIKNNSCEFINKINFISKQYNCKTIYLASDDYNFYELLSKDKEYIIIRNTIPPKDIGNLHYSAKNKMKQIINLLLDMYSIYKSDYFIPSYNSGLSNFIVKSIKIGDNFFDIPSKTIVIK